MKLVLQITLLVLLLAAEPIFSQVVMTRDEFPRTAISDDTGVMSYQSVETPEEGSSLNWSFPTLIEMDSIYHEFFDASGNDFFTSAFQYERALYALNGSFIFRADDYHELDDNGYREIGRQIENTIFPLATVTGGANDELEIVGGNVSHDGAIDLLQFPLEYNKTWTQSRVRLTNYKLTVESYALNKTPGQFKSYKTETRSVAGTGKLKMLDKNDMEIKVDVIMLKVQTTEIDSVFLGGQPAPPPLMAAFGLEQGAANDKLFYVFYAPCYGKSVASIDISKQSIFYRPIEGLQTNVEFTFNNSKTNMFPNPLTDNQTLTIENNDQTISKVVITDINGESVFQMDNQNQTNNMNINLPNNISSGVYFVKTTDEIGSIVDIRKLIIE